jgi:hypothetical protein
MDAQGYNQLFVGGSRGMPVAVEALQQGTEQHGNQGAFERRDKPA